MRPEYLEMMRAHVDEGGNLSHQNGVDLLAEVETLRAALDGLLMVCGRTGNSLEDFEEQAAAFERETGVMRPGKDVPAAYGGSGDDREARRAKYNAWVETKIAAARAALKAAAE